MLGTTGALPIEETQMCKTAPNGDVVVTSEPTVAVRGGEMFKTTVTCVLARGADGRGCQMTATLTLTAAIWGFAGPYPGRGGLARTAHTCNVSLTRSWFDIRIIVVPAP